MKFSAPIKISYEDPIMKNKLILIAILFFGVFGLVENSKAADCTHYVSPTGAQTTWASCTGSNNSGTAACSVATAFSQASSGNIVCFRGNEGAYNVPAKNFRDSYYGYYSPSNSGYPGNYIIFQAYPNEAPLFNGTTGGSGDNADGTYVFATIFGVASKSYIIFDGFHFQANGGTAMPRMVIYGEDTYPGGVHHITVKNCTFNGGSTIITGTGNVEGIRVEDADYITIKNNTIYNYKTSGKNCWHNTSGTKAYHTRYCVYENNEVYNCCAGMYDKSQGTDNIYLYNFVHDCSDGILIFCDGYSNTGARVYQNLIINISGISIDMQDDDGLQVTDDGQIYNNTIYSASGGTTAINVAYGTNHIIHSNIIYASPTEYGDLRLKYATSTNECNYNNYYGGSFKNSINYTGYISLTSWRALTFIDGGIGPDAKGSSVDPLFVNPGGSNIADYALQTSPIQSPCIGAGKNGVNMGADVSLVGIKNGQISDTIAPASPQGLNVS